MSDATPFQCESGIHYYLNGLYRDDLILKLPVIPVDDGQHCEYSNDPKGYEMYSYPRVRITPNIVPAASTVKVITQLPRGTAGFNDPIVVDAYTKAKFEVKPHVTYEYLYNKWQRK